MSMFNDIPRGSENNKQECESNTNLVSICAQENGHSSDLDQTEKKLYSIHEFKPQREWDRVAEQMMIKFAENGHAVFRAMSPLLRGTLKSKGAGKLSVHF